MTPTPTVTETVVATVTATADPGTRVLDASQWDPIFLVLVICMLTAGAVIGATFMGRGSHG